MSWMTDLAELYDKQFGQEGVLPLYHSTAMAHVEVVIDEDGGFVSANRISEKSLSETMIPVTEESESRTSGITPHPIVDGAKYLVKGLSDHIKPGGKKKEKSTEAYYDAYVDQLQRWIESGYGCPDVLSIYQYVSKGCMFEDLVQSGVYTLDDDGYFTDEKVLGSDQDKVVIRFLIQRGGKDPEKIWLNKSLQEANIAFNRNCFKKTEQMCYATGQTERISYTHPKKVRNAADSAKLISSTDTNFSYTGDRFVSKEEATSVGYEFSRKFHNMLKWLNQKQGIRIGDTVVTVWSPDMDLPNILKNPMGDDADEGVSERIIPFREAVSSALFGKRTGRLDGSRTKILIQSAATPGRLACQCIELPGSEFEKNLEDWHMKVAWNRYNGKKKVSEPSTFSLYEIVRSAYGVEKKGSLTITDQAFEENLILRLIPCVTEGRQIPRNFVNQLVRRASSPNSYKYKYRTVLETACGVIRGYSLDKNLRTGGVEEMALDTQYNSRSYLYGRLLAIADVAEASTYTEEDKYRVTNAKRYMESFSNKPYRTWQIIHNRLLPYLGKMGKPKRIFYTRLLDDVMALFSTEEFKDNAKLEPEYLLGYHCQEKELYTKKEDKNQEEK